MSEKERLRKVEKKVWKLLSRLYNKGYISSLGFEKGEYHFSFRHDSLQEPDKKIKE